MFAVFALIADRGGDALGDGGPFEEVRFALYVATLAGEKSESDFASLALVSNFRAPFSLSSNGDGYGGVDGEREYGDGLKALTLAIHVAYARFVVL